MFDSETVKIVIWGILGIAGLLLAISRMRFEKRLDWRIGIGIPLFGVSLFVLTTELPQYGIGFSIVGTLIMAGAALMAIKQSHEQANQRRKDELDRENRNRRECLLNEIIEWAENVSRFNIEADIDLYLKLLSVGGKTEKEQEVERSHRATLLSRILPVSIRTQYMNIVISKVGRELNKPSIEVAGKEVAENLDNCVAVLRQGVIGKVSTTEVGLSTEKLKESAKKLIDEATNIKIYLLNLNT